MAEVAAVVVMIVAVELIETWRGSSHSLPRVQKLPRMALPLAWTGLLVAAATALGLGLGRRWLADADVVMVYLAVIMWSAVRFGRASSLLAAALSIGAYDFFFVQPKLTFSVADPRHLLTFAMMFAVGAFLSSLALRLKREKREALGLLALTRAASTARDRDAVTAALVAQVRTVLGREGRVLEREERGELDDLRALGALRGLGLGAGAPSRVDATLPLASSVGSEGTLTIAGAPLDPGERRLAEAFASHAGMALERLRLSAEAESVRIAGRNEEMKSALLGAVSHDLRTPLATIAGAATALLEDGAPIPADERRALLVSIADEAFHLERLVGDLLDMTRVEGGALVLRREWVPLEEMVGSAIARTERRLGARRVSTSIAADVPLLHVDAALFERVIINLLDNAAKHTPESANVALSARRIGPSVELVVSDDGPGLPADIDVFDKFVRGPPAPRHAGQASRGGVGLGLSICRGIVRAHGGEMASDAHVLRGASFRVTLPADTTAPSVEAAS